MSRQPTPSPSEGSPTLTNNHAPEPRPHRPQPRVDLAAVIARFRAITDGANDLRAALTASVIDIPALVSEIEAMRRQYADLLAAARATLAADRDGETDPLYYLRDETAVQLGSRP